MELKLGEGWNLCVDSIPERREEGGVVSERCLVWYKGVANRTGDEYGIAFYHYDPPFKCIGEWVDFAHYGRQPIAWKPINPPFIKETEY